MADDILLALDAFVVPLVPNLLADAVWHIDNISYIVANFDIFQDCTKADDRMAPHDIPATDFIIMWPDPHDINVQAVILLSQCLMVSKNVCRSFVDSATDTRHVLEIFDGNLSHNHLSNFVGHTGETLCLHARVVWFHVEDVMVVCSELAALVMRQVGKKERK